MIVDYRKDTHPSRNKVNNYAMPHLNARYDSDDIADTTWTGDYPVCAACGTSHGKFEVHHEPPRSNGSLLLISKWGRFVVKPALVCLCKRCHTDRTEKRLKIDWEWDTPEDEELFWNGWYMSHGYEEHSEMFWGHGKVVLARENQRWEIRR